MATLAHPCATADPAQAIALVEAYVGSLVDYLPSPLLIADAAGRVVRANPEAERLLPPREVVGRPIRSVLPFIDADAGQVWLGSLGGLSLRVRRTWLACPPVGVQIYVLEPLGRFVHPTPLRRSRFATSRSASPRHD
jgi:PAS domain-containing protein